MQEEKKTLKVRVSDAEFEHFQRVAFSRGRIKTQDALMEAIRLWYARDGAIPAPSPFGELSRAEERILSGVLAYLRDKPYGPEKAPVIALFEALGKRYAGK